MAGVALAGLLSCLGMREIQMSDELDERFALEVDGKRNNKMDGKQGLVDMDMTRAGRARGNGGGDIEMYGIGIGDVDSVADERRYVDACSSPASATSSFAIPTFASPSFASPSFVGGSADMLLPSVGAWRGK